MFLKHEITLEYGNHVSQNLLEVQKSYPLNPSSPRGSRMWCLSARLGHLFHFGGMDYLDLLPVGLENSKQSSQQEDCGKSMRTVTSWKRARVNQYSPQSVMTGQRMCFNMLSELIESMKRILTPRKRCHQSINCKTVAYASIACHRHELWRWSREDCASDLTVFFQWESPSRLSFNSCLNVEEGKGQVLY